MQSFMNELEPARMVQREGWRKLPVDGHINIRIQMEDLLPESFNVVERVEDIRDRQGKVTGQRRLYAQEMTYTFAARASITDYKGIHIMDRQLANRERKMVFRSPEFQVRQLAEGYFLLNSMKVTQDLIRQNVTRAMNNLSAELTQNFGYAAVTLNDHLWIVGSRKHAEYDAHRKAFREMTSALFGLDANTPVNGLREKLKPVIDYFEGVKKRYNTQSKHDRKLRYASYFNLAVIYYYLDDPASMMHEAQGLILNDFDSRDGRGFEQVAMRLREQMQIANVSSRHFPIDVNKFKGPYEQNTATSR
jgi:hypothetical protein